MVLHDDSLILWPKSICDVLAFLIAENDTAIIRVYGQVVVEQTGILLHDVDRFAERGPGPAVEAMTVGGSNCIGTFLVKRMVNHVARFVDG